MSKYKVKFSVASNYINTTTEEVFDLVDDFGWDEEIAKEATENYEKTGSDEDINDAFNSWVWENIDSYCEVVK